MVYGARLSLLPATYLKPGFGEITTCFLSQANVDTAPLLTTTVMVGITKRRHEPVINELTFLP